MKNETPKEYFPEWRPPKNPKFTPKNNPKVIEPNYKEQLEKIRRMAKQMQKEQKFICDKTNDAQAALYETGVETGIDRIVKLIERHGKTL